MKRFLALFAAAMSLFACNSSSEVPFTEVKNYFFRNDATIPSSPKIDSQQQFESLFGAAAFMGKGGEPTEIDFEKEFVIAVVCPVTDVATELAAESLHKAGDKLVFTYRETRGERQSWSMQPVLLVKVDRKNDCQDIILSRELHEETCNPIEYKSFNQDNMQRVRDFLHEAGVYFLATVDGDTPQVRPFGTAEIIEGKLYIQTGHVKNVAKQIAANPKVAICAYKADEGRWLRISATLVEDPRVEVKKAMLDANPGLRSMYDENDSNTAVYFLKDAKATINSFTAEPIEIDF